MSARGARRAAWRLVASVTAAVAAAGAATAVPAEGTERGAVRVDLRVLVLDDGEAPVAGIRAALDREGVPLTVVPMTDTDRPLVDAGFLADLATSPHRGRFQAVLASDVALRQLAPPELEAIHAYQRSFAVRLVNLYTWPHGAVGLAAPGYAGPLDGAEALATVVGRSAGFGYLDGPVPFDPGSYGYLARPASAALEPLVEVTLPGVAGSGVLVGAHTTSDGREELVVTASTTPGQVQARVLAHGIITWATRGVHLGLRRHHFTVHIDDVLFPNDRWSVEGDCSAGPRCPIGPAQGRPPKIRMTPEDVEHLRRWQRANDFQLDLAFNGEGALAGRDASGVDPLTEALLAAVDEFRWINHTYDHHYLGCVRDDSVEPARCVRDDEGFMQWVPEAEIAEEIGRNQRWAAEVGIPIDPGELVTGEHSGLRALPLTGRDNHHLAPALQSTGIRIIASDNSQEPAQRAVGAAITLPRHPMNIFYNAATRWEEVDEYNWIYASAADGGSGSCEGPAGTSACLAPLDPATGFEEHIVPTEAATALRHVLDGDPRPHYAHQSNLAEDRILYPVLDEVLARYRGMFADDTPLLQPTMTEAAQVLAREARWRRLLDEEPDVVQAYTLGGVLHVEASRRVEVPITVPVGTLLDGAPVGEPYGGERSGWITVGPPPLPAAAPDPLPPPWGQPVAARRRSPAGARAASTARMSRRGPACHISRCRREARRRSGGGTGAGGRRAAGDRAGADDHRRPSPHPPAAGADGGAGAAARRAVPRRGPDRRDVGRVGARHRPGVAPQPDLAAAGRVRSRRHRLPTRWLPADAPVGRRPDRRRRPSVARPTGAAGRHPRARGRRALVGGRALRRPRGPTGDRGRAHPAPAPAGIARRAPRRGAAGGRRAGAGGGRARGPRRRGPLPRTGVGAADPGPPPGGAPPGGPRRLPAPGDPPGRRPRCPPLSLGALPAPGGAGGRSPRPPGRGWRRRARAGRRLHPWDGHRALPVPARPAVITAASGPRATAGSGTRDRSPRSPPGGRPARGAR